jgi:hypothetical protein
MAIGFDSIWSSLKDGVAAINNLSTTIKTIFPQLSGNSTSAPASAGAITFTSSQAVGFQLVTLSSGTTVKVPYYNQ